MANNDNLDLLNEILGLMQEAADTAVSVDRNQDSRIWADLNLLMSGDHVDFSHIKVLLPKFLTNYGDFNSITNPLIKELMRYIQSMHRLSKKIETKQRFPKCSLPSIEALKREYNNIKDMWDETLLLAMKQVNIDTDIKFDKYALLQVLNKSNGNSQNIEAIMEGI